MDKIRVVTDSASDIALSRDDLTVIPLHITFGEETFLDGIEISSHEFYERLVESDTLPKTSLISPSEYSKVYETAISNNEKVIVITLSGKLSGTYQSAVIAAEEFGDQIKVVDSENATIGQKILVEYAFQQIDNGVPFEEIVNNLENAKHRVHLVALLDTLEYLKKGGRISATTAFLGGALNIKPVVTVRNGEVVVLGKARGSKNGSNFLVQDILSCPGIDFSMPLCLGYTGFSDAMLQKYIEDSRALWDAYTEILPYCIVGPTIGTHIGPGGIAVAFFEKESL